VILDTIVAHKREEVESRKRDVPLAELVAQSADRPPPLDLAAALCGPDVRLIAEVKRASPSKGVFAPDVDAVLLARSYATHGAAAISVLTDSAFFHGQLEELTRIKADLSAAQLPIPVLRKDFIFDPYQVHESRASGADAVLLIANVLADDTLGDLLKLTLQLGMTPLVEVHSREEVEMVVPLGPPVIGINNRNLKNFSVDLNTFGALRRLLPEATLAVAESGVHSAADVQRLAQMGAHAVLVGEALVTAGDVPRKVRELSGIRRATHKARNSVSAHL
jgi:indole-3-glycerol phosphate synthase